MAETKEKLDPMSAEAIIDYLLHWEQQRLAKGHPKERNQEYGLVIGEMRRIGERCARRLNAALQNRCGACGRPITSPQGPYQTVSIFDINLGSFQNQYACRESCFQKLQQQARDASAKLQQAQS